RVLVVSDGRATGADPSGAARRLAARGIAINHRWLGREDAPRDLAVTSLDLPASVAEREPFLLTASVHATEAANGTVTLRRNGQPLARGPYAFRAGANLLSFRDLVEASGVVAYELTVEADGDGVVENDVGRAVLRIEGPARVLLITSNAGGVMEKALRDAGLVLQVRTPGPLTQVELDGVGAVVLENVEASALGEPGLRVLAQYVRDAGGGLVMTGGRRSFGEGGYRKSPIEDVLPVSLEMRQEQRKASIALSILMDCSCSMGATVPDGRTKMQLAAEGAVAALELLNPEDEASVHMIDTQVHEIFGLSPVQEGLPLDKVASGFSGGGGIYVGEALRAGRSEVLESGRPTRHVLLFSDAADSEEPADYRETLARLRSENVTVSVIGMGTPADPDAKLLEEIAALGGGRLYFAEDPVSLPRIFSQETIAVARATFVDAPAALVPGADLPLLGRVSPTNLPQVGGYNLTWLRPQASVAVRSGDDNAAPIVALWPHGAGRVVAFTTEADGLYSGALTSWDGYRALLEQMVRWTLPAKNPGSTDLVARAVRRGNDLHLTLDFPPESAPTDAEPTALVLTGDGKSAPIEVPLRWEAEDRLGAHLTGPGAGTFHPVIRVGDRALRA
ncbi:MAG: VWA domain-containing protein, partial [Myxococcaceae bacterium]